MKMHDFIYLFIFYVVYSFRRNKIQKYAAPGTQHPGVKEVVLLFLLYSKGLIDTFAPTAPGMTEVLMVLSPEIEANKKLLIKLRLKYLGFPSFRSVHLLTPHKTLLKNCISL